VEDIQDDFGVAIPQHDVPTNGDAFAIGRRRGKAALQLDGNDVNLPLHVPRELGADHKPPLLPGGQPIFLSKTGREVPVIYGVPVANLTTIMVGKAVAATIVIIVVVSMSILVPPMSVVVVLAPILVVLVFICKSRVSWKHEESKNDYRKPFSSFQRFLQEGVG
jgi:hypothetical protein